MRSRRLVLFFLPFVFFLAPPSPSFAQITVANVRVVPAFRHLLVGAYINPGTNVQATMTVAYRKLGTVSWKTAHEGMRSTNDPFWISTVIFWLAESTSYEVHVVVADPGGVTSGDQTFTVQTRSRATPIGSGSTYTVSPAGDDVTGTGSSGSPWKTLTRADAAVSPGDTVIVRGGAYAAGEVLTRGGSQAGGYVLYRAASGETPVFDGSDAAYAVPNSGNRFAPVPGRPGVFSASPGYAPVYVASGGERLYNYAFDENTPLDSLTAGTVTHNGTAYAVAGWLYQSGTLYVHLAGGADPDTVSMHIVEGGPGIQIDNADYVAIQGITLRYVETGIQVRGDHEAGPAEPAGRYAWIDGNSIDHIGSTGVLTTGWTTCGATVGTDASIGAPGAVLIRNTLSDAANTTAWPWDVKKGSDAENGAINLEGGDGAIVRDNVLHDVFNGIAASNWGDCFWGGFPLESAGMNRHAVVEKNTVTDIGDDVVEPEGAILNFVIQQNKALRVHTGISMAPIGEGPVWVVRNEVVDYLEGCLKFWDGMSANRGWILIYHNTFVTRLAASDAMLVYPASDYGVKVRMRNNIAVGTAMAVDAGDPGWGTPNVSLDHDDFHSSTGSPPAVLWYYQGTVTCGGGGSNDHCWYDSVAEWIADSLAIGQPQEQNGLDVDPAFVDQAGGNFHLTGASPVVDQGVVVTGIDEGFAGSAPDLGAYEYPKNVILGQAEFSGDAADEIGVFRNGMWFLAYSPDHAGVDQTTAFGSPVPGADSPELGEFNCVPAGGGMPDGRTDLAILRKPFSTWQATLSEDWGSAPDFSITFGTTDHKRISTRRLDTNGDGCSDIGVFRNGCFDIVESPGYASVARHVCFGLGTDEPLGAELNGDGMSDLLLWRAGSSHYSYRFSPGYAVDQGVDLGAGDLPLVGDLNGDGRSDLGSYRQLFSTFRFTYSPDFAGSDLTRTHGMNGDIPILADVNGDGRSDLGIFRNATARWWFRCSADWNTTCVSQSFGVAGDIPVYGKPPGML